MKPSDYFKNSSYYRNKTTFYKSLEELANQTLYSNKERALHQTNAPGRKRKDRAGERKRLYDSFMKKVMDELFESESSSIGKEVAMDSATRERVAGDFLERQQFMAQQSKVLKQMAEFCQYGVIRPGFT